MCLVVCVYVGIVVVVVLVGEVLRVVVMKVVMLMLVEGIFRWLVHGAPVGGGTPSPFHDDEG